MTLSLSETQYGQQVRPNAPGATGYPRFNHNDWTNEKEESMSALRQKAEALAPATMSGLPPQPDIPNPTLGERTIASAPAHLHRLYLPL